MAAVAPAQEAPKITFRDLDPEDLKNEKITKIALGALAFILLAAAAVGYYFLLKKGTDQAIHINAKIIAPIMGTLAGIVAAAVAPFVDFEKGKVGSTDEVKRNAELREHIRDVLVNKAIDMVHDELYKNKNGGLGVERHVNALGNDENREKARKILKEWQKEVVEPDDAIVDQGRKAIISENWRKLQAHVRGEAREEEQPAEVPVKVAEGVQLPEEKPPAVAPAV
jgi:hypothetical protein